MNLNFIQIKKVLYHSTVAIILIATVFAGGIFTTTQVLADTGSSKYLLAQSPVGSLEIAADIAKLKTEKTLGDQIGLIIKGVLGLLGTLLLLMFIYGGFVWMTASGNEEKVQQANKIIKNAVIGIIIIFLSYAITDFLIKKVEESTTATLSTTTII
jgi:hypothetical protein